LLLTLKGKGNPFTSAIVIPRGTGWQTIEVPVKGIKPDVYDIVVSLKEDKPVELDWISFQ